MNGTNFTAPELCEIIKSCGEAGVMEFTYGKISIQFSGKVKSPTWNNYVARPKMDVAEQRQPVPLEVKRSFEEEMSDLLITDPLQYEERLMSYGEDQANAKVKNS